ncbi:hypothetical protein [Mesorhizobium sp. M7A.F.Ca.MR.362.00.0.0]|uniref:Bbp19 family protein n=1 Tax=Mesorhizobium sp. M7A.F.Ca.MR.362.00.0.0 TaxID=2496779 RepID=UPI000FD1C544|nr:hypothetical protein [Mesorhizobium sp. M7A.F.Ca.MR.362.00.0.0]RUU80009.1 hypothetical protein EOC06_13945 [Mesorhizobium sp. M7A.F.Ca.MR.362.00.0.0]
MSEAHAPAPYDKDILMAIRALIAGKANEGQQQTAMDWIIQQASNLYDVSYRKQDSHATAFAEGRRFVGNQIVKMTRPEALKAVEGNGPKPVRGKRQTND